MKMSTAEVRVTHERRTVELVGGVKIRAADEDGETRKMPMFEAIVYSGAQIRQGWTPHPVVIDLAGVEVESRTPILRGHDADKIVGHCERVEVAGGAVVASGVLSGGNEHAREVVESSRNGFPWQASVGGDTIRMTHLPEGKSRTVNGREVEGPAVIVEKMRLKEVSFVPIGADSETQVRIAAKRPTEHKDSTMSEVQNEAIRAERARIEGINSVSDDPRFPLPSDIRAKLIETGASVDEAVLTQMRLAAESVSGIVSSPSYGRPGLGGAKPEDVIGAALMIRAGIDPVQHFGEVAAQRAEDLRCRTLLDIAAAAVKLDGKEVPRNAHQLVKAAFSTISMPKALGLGVEKVALDGFQRAEEPWRAIARRVPLNSFRQSQVLRLADELGLERVPRDGELKSGFLGEHAAPIRLETWGKLITIPRQDIIDDDAGLLADIPRRLGLEGARTIGDEFAALLLANDGAFFSTNNSNILEGSSGNFGLESMTDAIAKMRRQRDSSGRTLNLTPRFLLVGADLEQPARALLNSTEIASETEGRPIGNPLRGVAELHVDARIDDGRWFLFAGQLDAPVVVGLLGGRDGPVVEEVDAGPDRLGWAYRCFTDFGVALVEPRAAVTGDPDAESETD